MPLAAAGKTIALEPLAADRSPQSGFTWDLKNVPLGVCIVSARPAIYYIWLKRSRKEEEQENLYNLYSVRKYQKNAQVVRSFFCHILVCSYRSYVFAMSKRTIIFLRYEQVFCSSSKFFAIRASFLLDAQIVCDRSSSFFAPLDSQGAVTSLPNNNTVRKPISAVGCQTLRANLFQQQFQL